MGPPESVTGPRKNQAAGRRKRRARRPRARGCLLKGCEQRVRPRHARQRYCSAECREKARKWSRWKAQQKYRMTADGKQKRNGQSGRYRERVKSRKPAEAEAVSGAARVITQAHFFRAHLRRPGCYERFVQQRRSPLQRFCCASCRRALERVQERERRWKQARI